MHPAFRSAAIALAIVAPLLSTPGGADETVRVDVPVGEAGWAAITFSVAVETEIRIRPEFRMLQYPMLAGYGQLVQTGDEATTLGYLFAIRNGEDGSLVSVQTEAWSYEEEVPHTETDAPLDFDFLTFLRTVPAGTHTVHQFFAANPPGSAPDGVLVLEGPGLVIERVESGQNAALYQDRDFDAVVHVQEAGEEANANVIVQGAVSHSFENGATALVFTRPSSTHAAASLVDIDGPRECTPYPYNRVLRGAPSGDYVFRVHAHASVDKKGVGIDAAGEGAIGILPIYYLTRPMLLVGDLPLPVQQLRPDSPFPERFCSDDGGLPQVGPLPVPS